MKIITYHYIRDFSKEYPYFNSLYKKEFLKQLDYFEKKFGIIENEDEIYKKNNKILLTFDDGLKEHLFVAKELAKRKKIGIFFPLTKNFEGKKELLNVHKTHLILGKMNPKIALEDLKFYLDKFNKKKVGNLINSKFKKIYKFFKDNKDKDEFKKIINYSNINNHKSKEFALNNLLKKYKIKIKPNNFYLSKKEIKLISKLGMIIGCHTHSHHLLSNLSYEKQSIEIRKSKKFLKNLINKDVKFFCYPYGNKYSYNKNTIRLLRKNKFSYSFTDIHKSVSLNKFKSKPFEIPRYDCNQF